MHASYAWYGCWTIKALVEAEVYYEGFYCELRVHNSTIDHSETLVSLSTSNYKTSIKPIQWENALVTLVVYIHHLWLSNKPSSSNLAQNLVGKKIALPG
jgi:hypothetical protein